MRSLSPVYVGAGVTVAEGTLRGIDAETKDLSPATLRKSAARTLIYEYMTMFTIVLHATIERLGIGSGDELRKVFAFKPLSAEQAREPEGPWSKVAKILDDFRKSFDQNPDFKKWDLPPVDAAPTATWNTFVEEYNKISRSRVMQKFNVASIDADKLKAGAMKVFATARKVYAKRISEQYVKASETQLRTADFVTKLEQLYQKSLMPILHDMCKLTWSSLIFYIFGDAAASIRAFGDSLQLNEAAFKQIVGGELERDISMGNIFGAAPAPSATKAATAIKAATALKAAVANKEQYPDDVDMDAVDRGIAYPPRKFSGSTPRDDEVIFSGLAVENDHFVASGARLTATPEAFKNYLGGQLRHVLASNGELIKAIKANDTNRSIASASAVYTNEYYLRRHMALYLLAQEARGDKPGRDLLSVLKEERQRVYAPPLARLVDSAASVDETSGIDNQIRQGNIALLKRYLTVPVENYSEYRNAYMTDASSRSSSTASSRTASPDGRPRSPSTPQSKSKPLSDSGVKLQTQQTMPAQQPVQTRGRARA